MKKLKFAVIIGIILAIVTLSACSPTLHNPREHEVGAIFKRDPGMLDFSGVDFTPWDVTAGGIDTPREEKPWTILIYMNGSDLESETGEATADIAEMLGSGVTADNANVIILTGGTKKWQRSEIPTGHLALWEVDGGSLRKLADLPQLSMGAAGTLASFLEYGQKYYPAKRTGLILWDHGGGSIAGFGHDEHFDDELSLLELNYALKKSVSPRRKLEFVGFDACLMATVEVGVVVSDYAKYLVASQDLEPAEGWDYAFLREISARPHINGEALGRLICDYYMKFFSENGDHDHYLTMSVIDVQKLTEVMKSLGTFGAQGKEKISGGGLAAIAETRSKTIAFGGSSYRDANCDMVDIRDICEEFRPYFIECADMLKTSLYGAVVHNVHNAEHDLGGLSVYFVYHGARQAQANLDIYSELYMSADYTNFLFAFADGVRARGGTLRGILSDFFSRSTRSTGETIIDGKTFVCSPVLYKEEHGEMCVVGNIHHQNSEGGVAWLAVEDCPLISTKISGSTNTEVHSVQVRHNDKTGEMLIKIEKSDDAMPNAKILGIRYDCTPMKRKGLFQLKRGDKLELLEPDGNSRTFQFTIEKSIKLEYITSIGYVEGCCVADMYGDKYFCKS